MLTRPLFTVPCSALTHQVLYHGSTYYGFTDYDSTCDGSTYHRYAYHGSTHYTLFTSCHQVLGQLKASVVVLGGWCIFDQVSTASKRYVTKSAPWCIRSAELHS